MKQQSRNTTTGMQKKKGGATPTMKRAKQTAPTTKREAPNSYPSRLRHQPKHQKRALMEEDSSSSSYDSEGDEYESSQSSYYESAPGRQTPPQRRRERQRKKTKPISRTEYLLLIMIIGMIIMISMQLQNVSLFEDTTTSTSRKGSKTSLQDVFPDFVNKKFTWEKGNPHSQSKTRSIHKYNKNDITVTPNDIKDNNHDVPKHNFEFDEGRTTNPILKILKQAGYNLNDKRVFTKEVLDMLPDWKTITDFYGPPVIVGLDKCQEFQQRVRPKKRLMSIAGTFNSGTNFLADVLTENCYNPAISTKRKGAGVRWQVPWGKHTPSEYRGLHLAPKYGNAPVEEALAIVTTRDPYTWMSSMCRQNYAALFDHNKEKCPNLIPYQTDIKEHPRYGKMNYIPVHVRYDKDIIIKHESLAHVWKSWYGSYLYQNSTVGALENKAKDPYGDHPKIKQAVQQSAQPEKFPRIIVRMEDVIFHADIVIPKLCECAGFEFHNEFGHVSEMSNNNPGTEKNQLFVEGQSTGSSSSQVITGLLRSIIKYGNITNRRTGYPAFQLEAAKDILSEQMMATFQYKIEEPGEEKEGDRE